MASSLSPSPTPSTQGSPSGMAHTCVQELTALGGAVLAVALSPTHVFCGSQQGDIHVWRRDTFRLETTLEGHTGGCHALAVMDEVLFSGGGDGRVRAWDMRGLRGLYVIHAGVNSGAVLSLAVVGTRLVLGCQNTSLQWFDVAARDDVPKEERRRELLARRLRFFDDSGPIGVCPASTPGRSADNDEPLDEYLVAESHIVDYAHSGYVYSVVAEGGVVYSGGSDGAIRMWTTDQSGLVLAGQLERSAAADVCVHALALDSDGLLFAGLQSGGIDVWDLETRQRIRTLPAHSANVFALAVSHRCLFSASADGSVRAWDADLQALGELRGGGSVLAMAVDGVLVAGHGDGAVRVWEVAAPEAAEPVRGDARLVQALAQWVRFRSVAGVPALQPECRRAARFLRDLMLQLGAADARLIAATPHANPVVYGRFGAGDDTVFVYGHYDVMPAGDDARWASPPFEMTGRDGYVYGRGVSDDKGPVLATLFAVAELHAAGLLRTAVVFCIEGEEEHGSLGLYETVEAHRALFGVPRLVLLSSSYWLGEATPCLTYGMRGSIRARVRVESSRNADVHSGVWGGAVNEPLTCLAHMLAALVDPAGRVLVPGFHDAVRPVSAAEEEAMRELVAVVAAREKTAPVAAARGLDRQLLRRWRQPALTVHHVEVSTVAAPENATLVPAAAQAAVSVRVVPDQALGDIAAKLEAHITHVFEAFVAARPPALLDDLKLDLEVKPIANWWLADPQTPVYRAALKAIGEVWGMDAEPLLIREGGSIPAVPWLEAFFAPHAIAVNLPMGQSSDNAHLDNERISLENLQRGRQVVYQFLRDLTLH